MSTFFRFVPIDMVVEFEARGWRLSHNLRDCRHGAHAVLMIWEGAGEPA